MSIGRDWGTSKDGRFEYVSITCENLENGLEVMRDSFFIDENISIAVELYKNPESIKELEELCVRAARDGVSVLAIEKSTGKPAGASFNKIQVKTDDDHTYFEKFAANCKHESSKNLVQFMIEADAECDLFKHYNVDCLMELMFVATMPEFRGNGIGQELFAVSEKLARELLAGNNVKCSITEEPLSLEPVPKLTSGILTSFITKKIGDKLGYVTLADIGYEKWSFQGRTYAERIGSDTKSTTLVAKLLV